MKYCPRCETDKNLSEFSPDRSTKSGIRVYCKTCVRNEGRDRRARKPYKKIYNPEIARKKRQQRTAKQLETASLSKRKHQLKALYGITAENYKSLFEKQQGKCAICDRHQTQFKNDLSVDHNHVTKNIRGLLCPPCNRAIGILMADYGTAVLRKAVKYVDGEV